MYNVHVAPFYEELKSRTVIVITYRFIMVVDMYTLRVMYGRGVLNRHVLRSLLRLRLIIQTSLLSKYMR